MDWHEALLYCCDQDKKIVLWIIILAESRETEISREGGRKGRRKREERERERERSHGVLFRISHYICIFPIFFPFHCLPYSCFYLSMYAFSSWYHLLFCSFNFFFFQNHCYLFFSTFVLLLTFKSFIFIFLMYFISSFSALSKDNP